MATTKSTPLSETDLEMLYLIHDAFRRDSERLTRVAEHGVPEDPATHDAVLLGWHGFSTTLHHHHTIEDEMFWPLMRTRLQDEPDDLEVLDAMEAEHALLDPSLAAVEEAFDDREHGPDVLAERLDTVVHTLRSHLAHEEKDALPLMARTITAREVQTLTKDAIRSVSRSELREATPYLFEGAPEDRTRRLLRQLPLPVRLLHRFWWNPQYRRVRRWE
ncbi:hemerythrin domain-containing protein [Rhodococcus sp. HM1]|uniref:hemerythrin domain-containing protein n=1 Tax=Rhodococcus sp. HM1 TaxID=2937759 RepID=UPI00200B612D|nr:hemerythrin domain-containing protein [Rhodococcus sp. HM1]MCK8669578.1 hemerythrin domain-containing protein [Rhodococcus sp. HM1]